MVLRTVHNVCHSQVVQNSSGLSRWMRNFKSSQLKQEITWKTKEEYRYTSESGTVYYARQETWYDRASINGFNIRKDTDDKT